MLKKLLPVILAISLILGMSVTAIGVPQPLPSIVLNDEAISLQDKTLINEEGHIFCPLRELVELLDYQVTWDGNDQSIILTKESQVIDLKIGDPNIKVNEKNIEILSKPIIKEDKTFVPVEFFSKALDLVIDMNNNQQTLKIHEPQKNTETFFTMSVDNKTQEKLDDYMKALKQNQNFHGSVLVAKEGKVLLNQGYGFSDLKQNTMNKSQTKFAIGSITKQFTAMAIMQLSEKGLLDVNDKVSKYIPDLPNGDLITIHNLLTHTSGLKNFTELNEFMMLNTDNKDPMVCVNLIKDIPLEFEPGEKYLYCNTNYVLLGMIVEKVAEIPLADYLQNNIFNPLNMTNTGTSYSEDNDFCGATPYIGYLEVTPIDDKLTLTQTFGAGSLYSTVEDLYRWDRALKTEQLVKQQTLDQIFDGYISVSEGCNYGYGWLIANTDDDNVILHDGATMGFTSIIVRYVDADITIIVLTNNRLYDVMTLSNTLSSIILNKDYEMPKIIKEIEIDDPNLYDSYVGKYYLDGTYLNIIKNDNNLYAQLEGQNAFEIFPMTKNNFFAKQIEVTIEFVTNDKDEVTEVILEQLGMKFVYKVTENTKDNTIITVDSSIYDAYVGEYELTENIIYTITKEDNKIYAQLTGQDKFEIFPISETEYIYKLIDAKIVFEKDDSGQVVKLILHQNGQEMPASKIK